jgi:hypothetical protein
LRNIVLIEPEIEKNPIAIVPGAAFLVRLLREKWDVRDNSAPSAVKRFFTLRLCKVLRI